MNVLFTECGDLLLPVGDAHAHEELVFGDCLAHLLNPVFIGVELIDHVHLLYFVCFLVVGLPAHYQDAVVVGGEVHRDHVAAEGELLLRRQLDSRPLVSHDRVTLYRIQTLRLPGLGLENEVFVHAAENVD